jgi:hypothetical protein
MYTTYHFNSVTEITTDILESIKSAFKGKAIVLTVEEEIGNEDTPHWHIPVLQERLQNLDNTAFADTADFLNTFKG